MKVKEVERTANLAWSPAAQHPVMLAAGTAAQQLDASFSTSAQLEVCTLGLARPGLDMEVRASVPSEHRYHKVAWGGYGAQQEAAGGVIVGGCDGGRVQMYSAAKLLAGEESIVASKDKHVGPVRSLDFNPYQMNLLATGASESEIFIWDLNNTDTPMLPGAKSQPADDVLSLSWNRQVQHILASAFAQRCVVWDLRKNEPIIKLADSSSRVRWKALAWHPDVATQLCLASEEDQLPVIQLWDLRFATSPVKALQGHQRGVLSVAWCAQDPDLLASCGKENHIIIWNPNATDQSGEILCDLTTTNQWHFDVSWCPRNPALIACSSFDGHTSVYSLTGGQQQVQTSNKIADSFPGMDAFAQAPSSQPQAAAVDLRRAPRWLRRPCRAAFGFGGKLATFEWEAGAARHLVYVSQVVTEPQLVERSQLLEQVLQCGQLAEFCDNKAAAARSPHHKQMWRFLQARLSTDPRTELLALLGFKQDDIVSKLNRYLDKPANAKPSGGVAALGQEDHRQVNGVTAANFVNSAENISSEPLKIFTDDDGSGLISQALLLGNTEAAVELCLQEERFADAIILAMTGGSDLLARTQFRYFQKCKGALSALISAVVTEDWSHVVRNCSLDSWKEALAATLTHTKSDEFPALCGELAERLAAEGKDSVLSAQLCHVCAGDLDRLVDSWTAVFQPDTPDNLQELVELAVVLRKAAETTGCARAVSGQLAQLMSRYAGLLAAQGSLGTALAYLQDCSDESLSPLRERLFCALGHKQAYQQQQQPLQQGRGPRRTSAQGWQAQSASADESNYGKPYPSAGGYCTPDSKLFPVKTSKPIPPAQQPAVPTQQLYQPLMAQQFSAGVHPYGSQTPSQSYGSQTPAQLYGAQTPAQPYGSQPPAQLYGSQPPAQLYGSQPPAQLYGAQPPAQLYGSQPPAQPYGQTQTYSGGPRASSSPAPPGAGAGGSRGKHVLDPTLQANSGGPAFPQQLGPAPRPADVPAQSVPQQFQQTAAADSAPAGWNDPPSLGPVRAQPRVEYAPQTPITHPLYGTVPAEQPGSFAPPSAAVGGAYAEPAHSYAPPVQQRPPTPATPRHVVPPPLPEEFMYLQTVFDELRTRCMMAAANAQTKRKLEDVARKLETLYDALRACKLSPQTVQGLHQMVQMVQIGDYSGCLGLHTQLVSGPDFSQIASFMPGLKVLVQSALQLGVYLQ